MGEIIFLCTRLAALLKDPHPGLSTWLESRDDTIFRLHAELFGVLEFEQVAVLKLLLWRLGIDDTGLDLKADAFPTVKVAERIKQHFEAKGTTT